VLIPTIDGREVFFNHITRKLTHQINKVGTEKVQLLFYKDKRGENTTGAKRNVLLEQSKGKFVVFVDDDDDISPEYIPSIIATIQDNPDIDAIGIQGVYSENGNNQMPFETGARWNWETTNGWYTRFVNHISPIKRDIAIQFKFPDKTIGEDYDWTMQVKKSGLIKKDVIIKKKIYYYDYRPNKKDK
jgi:glycosyltransferase involved in cell wall biosynthesis